MATDEPDNQLLVLLKSDYRTAFRHLYKTYFRMTEYFITKNSGMNADAEDIFQEVMIILFNKCRDENFKLSCTVKTFIYSVARNLWLKKLRDRKKELRIKDYEAYENISVDEEQPDGDMQEGKIKAALESLGEKCRKILILFYYMKKSMEDISTELGYTNADNAKNQKYKCLQQLKQKMVSTDAA